jgi:hypothetical protein
MLTYTYEGDSAGLYVVQSETHVNKMIEKIIPYYSQQRIVIYIESDIPNALFEKLIDILSTNSHLRMVIFNLNERNPFYSIEHQKLLLKPKILEKILLPFNEIRADGIRNYTQLSFLLSNEILEYILANNEIKEALNCL